MRHLNFIDMTTWEATPEGLVRTPLPYRPLPSNYHLFFLNDTHVGNDAIHEGAIERFVRDVRSKKHSYVIAQGDQLETIDIGDKRYDIGCHGSRLSRYNAQRDKFLEYFDPIGDKFLLVLDGNHERRIKNIYQPNADIAKAFNAVYAGGTMAKLLFPGWRLMSWHGWGRINSRAGDQKQREVNEIISLKRNLRELPAQDCDIITCGHYHKLRLHDPTKKLLLVSDAKESLLKQYYSRPTRKYIDKDQDVYVIDDEDKWFMCCGSFLRGYQEGIPSYVEDAGMAATELGYGHIEVKNDAPHAVECVKV